MDKHIYYIIIAFIMVAMIPLMRQIIGFRILVLRWLKWKSMADIHERNIDRLTLIVRIIFVPIILYLFYLGYTGLTA
jgi:hypothetical protein